MPGADWLDELDQIRREDEARQKEKQLDTSGLSRKERARIRSDIKSLDMEYRDAARKLRHLERIRQRWPTRHPLPG